MSIRNNNCCYNFTINNKIKVDTLKKDAMPRNLFSQDKEGFAIQPSFFCVEYHPDVESRPVIDIETNDFIRYKSVFYCFFICMGSSSISKI